MASGWTLNRKCLVDGCERPHHGKGLCQTHGAIKKRLGDPLAVQPRRSPGQGCKKPEGYFVRQKNGKTKYEHVMLAERAIGGPLPEGAVVHHIDNNPSNNETNNLVVCPSHAYHMLLHRRQRAMDACGNPNWLLCCRCKKYDDPKNMRGGSTAYHQACNTEHQRKLRSTPRTFNF